MGLRVDIPVRAWARGQGLYKGLFLTIPGPTRCCLGFILAACGVPDRYLLGRGSITDLPRLLVEQYVPARLYEIHYNAQLVPSDVTHAVTRLNDDEATDDVEREEALIWALAPHDIHLTFYHSRERGGALTDSVFRGPLGAAA